MIKKRYWFSLAACFLVMVMVNVACGQENRKPLPVSENENGHLVYSKDEKGNRIPDFSYAGYMAGEKEIPNVRVKIVVPPKDGDDTRRIQSAIDYVASLPAGGNGIRGAVLLKKGTYKVSGTLTIHSSGVILRGSGMGDDGTTVIGTSKDRYPLIKIAGAADKKVNLEVKITDAYVPVNAMKFNVAAPDSFEVGDKVQVRRPSTEKWIETLGMTNFGGQTGWLGWKPGERDVRWDRTVTAVNGNTISIDAPLTTALDTTYGGGRIARYQWSGRIQQVGVENLELKSIYDKSNPKDEAHRWMAITMENVKDAWVRQVIFRHFAGSAVYVLRTGKRITVQDCQSLEPVSEIGGLRRNTFWTKGEQTLFQRLYAEDGYHDFAVGNMATLNVFVQSKSHLPHNFSGAINSWTSGTLFDAVRIDGDALKYFNRGEGGHGAGWTAANSVLWQCSAAKVANFAPPTAQNWAFGTWAKFAGNGYWVHNNEHIQPHSLYYAQLSDRLGKQVMARARLIPVGHTTSSPTVKQAAEFTANSTDPPVQLKNKILNASTYDPIPTDAENAKVLTENMVERSGLHSEAPPMHVKNGWLVRGDRVLTGKQFNVQWWWMETRPYSVKKATPHITRYVPGRYGIGLTDSLRETADWMANHNFTALNHNYGLWYDRRRDDHERVRRMNGDVWPPFYELPFARSGEGTAWDGLSKYDLTKYNHFYWSRLKEFADIADQKGLVLFNQNYFQHNIIEAGAHWADFPWRPANNINDTGLPEPPPYSGQKRIFLSKQFYNEDNPQRRDLHQAFIRKCMQNFVGNNGVIQFIGKEFTGPLHFVQFWLDTIKSWENDTGHDAFVGLSVTKDVQDAILHDPKRSPMIDIIDIRRWHYRDDGSLYAPKGGQFLAPRQHARLVDPGGGSFDQVYRAVREYREKYPDKAVMYSWHRDRNNYGWAAFMASGSLAPLPNIEPAGFLESASKMRPMDLENSPSNQWALGKKGTGYIVFDDSSDPINLDLSESSGSFTVKWINPGNGKLLQSQTKIQAGKKVQIQSPETEPVVAWIMRN